MKRGKVKKPWGGFERFTLNENSTVKILEIKPKQEFSLQKHKKRAEFWRILEGNCKVTVGNRTKKAKPGDEFTIGKNVKHRIEALGKTVRVLEISFGKFDEKDIKRLEDKYGRA